MNNSPLLWNFKKIIKSYVKKNRVQVVQVQLQIWFYWHKDMVLLTLLEDAERVVAILALG